MICSSLAVSVVHRCRFSTRQDFGIWTGTHRAAKEHRRGVTCHACLPGYLPTAHTPWNPQPEKLPERGTPPAHTHTHHPQPVCLPARLPCQLPALAEGFLNAAAAAATSMMTPTRGGWVHGTQRPGRWGDGCLVDTAVVALGSRGSALFTVVEQWNAHGDKFLSTMSTRFDRYCG